VLLKKHLPEEAEDEICGIHPLRSLGEEFWEALTLL